DEGCLPDDSSRT
nr:RecName: Full=Snaclec bitiscetin-2 [Bitis arietans]